MKETKEDILHIDLFNLEDEWNAQPNLYRMWSDKMAVAKSDLNDAKSNLEYVRARLYIQIMNDPASFGLEKTTEKAIDSALVSSDDYQEAQGELNDAKKNVAMLEGMLEALNQRKDALKDEVKLHLSGYFSEPTAPEGCREEVDMMKKRAVRRKGVRDRD